MGRVTAWVSALLFAGLVIWTDGWAWMQFSPISGKDTASATWSLFLIFWAGQYVWFYPFVAGFWLLGAAQGRGGGRWLWRWWVGGALALWYVFLVAQEFPLRDPKYDFFPGFSGLIIAESLLIIWPVFYWGLHHAERSAKPISAVGP